MPPPPASRPGAGGGRSGRDRSPRHGPSGLDLGSRSSPVSGASHLGYGGRSSPSPSGARDDDRSSAIDSLDTEWDDSFQAVLHLIREFHSLEEPASVAQNRCKTSLAPVYGLQSVVPSSSLAYFPSAAVSP